MTARAVVGRGVGRLLAAADGAAPQVQQNLNDLLADLARSNPMYAELIDRFTRGGNITANMMFLNSVFTLLVVVVAAFAVSLANRWANDEEGGPAGSGARPRRARDVLVMLTRFAACALGLTIVTGLILSGAVLASATVGMQLDTKRLAEAAFGMVPVGLVVASARVSARWLASHARGDRHPHRARARLVRPHAAGAALPLAATLCCSCRSSNSTARRSSMVCARHVYLVCWAWSGRH